MRHSFWRKHLEAHCDNLSMDVFGITCGWRCIAEDDCRKPPTLRSESLSEISQRVTGIPRMSPCPKATRWQMQKLRSLQSSQPSFDETWMMAVMVSSFLLILASSSTSLPLPYSFIESIRVCSIL